MTANIDAVAEAIYERHHADGDAPAWGELQAERRTHWRKVAQAGVDAFPLTELLEVINEMWIVDRDGQLWVHQGYLLDLVTPWVEKP